MPKLNADERVALIHRLITEAINPDSLQIIDDSHKHAGHASAGGGGHFNVEVVSNAFDGKSLVARHQLIYKIVAEPMAAGEIHALGIQAKTPAEAAA